MFKFLIMIKWSDDSETLPKEFMGQKLLGLKKQEKNILSSVTFFESCADINLPSITAKNISTTLQRTTNIYQ